MNKKDLSKCIAKEANISAKLAGDVINIVTDCIGGSLKKGDNVSLIGFGNFLVKRRAARTGVNPRTGEKIQIKASKVLKAKCN